MPYYERVNLYLCSPICLLCIHRPTLLDFTGDKNKIISFRRVRIVAKAHISFVISVRLHACISAATPGAISLKFGMGNVYENLSTYPGLVKVEEKCRALYMETRVSLTVASDNASPYRRFLGMKWYRAIRVATEV